MGGSQVFVVCFRGGGFAQRRGPSSIVRVGEYGDATLFDEANAEKAATECSGYVVRDYGMDEECWLIGGLWHAAKELNVF